MRRAVAVVGTAVLVAVALPARAQQVPQPQQSQQAQQSVVTAEVIRPVQGDVTSGVVRLKGRGSSPAGIKKVTISVDEKVMAVTEPGDFQQRAIAAYQWSSYFLPEASKIAPNRDYTVTVEAVSNGDQVDQASITIALDNQPVAPRGVKAAVKSDTVRLEWAPNPEPDLLGYAVERDSGKGFKEIERTRKPAFSEELAAGRYAYRVVAVRARARSKGVVTSPPSKPAGAVISPPPPPKSGGPLGGARGVPNKIGGAGALSNFFGGSPKAPNPRLPGAPKPKAPPTTRAARPPKTPEDNRHEEWGRYKRKLPYELEEAEPETHATGMTRIFDEVVPPDGARWVLIGGALLLLALFAAVMARRVKVPKGPPTSAETAGSTPA